MITSLNFIRVAGFFIIFLHHLYIDNFFTKHNGWIGMDLLFLLSSFLLTISYLKNGPPEFQNQLKKRFIRIYPSLLIFVLLMVGVTSGLPYLLHLGNFWVIKNGWDSNPFVGILWSISLLEQWYIFWLFVLSKTKQASKVLDISVALLLFSVFTKVLFFSNNPHTIYMNPLTRLEPFMMGSILAYFYYQNPQIILNTRTLFLSIFFQLPITYYFFHFDIRSLGLFHQVLGYTLASFWCLFLTTIALNLKNFNLKLINHFSDLGYHLFLWHVVGIIYSWRLTSVTYLRYLVAFLLSYLLALLFYFAEKKLTFLLQKPS